MSKCIKLLKGWRWYSEQVAYSFMIPPFTESQYRFSHCRNSRLSKGRPLTSRFTSICCHRVVMLAQQKILMAPKYFLKLVFDLIRNYHFQNITVNSRRPFTPRNRTYPCNKTWLSITTKVKLYTIKLIMGSETEKGWGIWIKNGTLPSSLPLMALLTFEPL